MTTPGPDSFQYNDDSVVARVSFDVPPSTLTDISQITQAMSAMRTELESIARAQSDWLDYLQQVPAIAERANQAYRDSITQMERIAYIQSEIGTTGPVGAAGAGGDSGGGVVPSGGAGGSGMGGYSTAAPAGYVPPFQNMTEGMGRKRETSPSVASQISALADENPRIAANMAAARGMAVNPSLLGMVGGAMGWAFGQSTGGGLGKGNEAADDMSPQTTGSDRTSSGPPAPSQGGAPIGSEPTNAPGPPSKDAPWWRKLTDTATNEIRNAAGGSRIGKILGTIPPGVLGDAFKNVGGGVLEGAAGTAAGTSIGAILNKVVEAAGGAGGAGGGTGGPPDGGGGGTDTSAPDGGDGGGTPGDGSRSDKLGQVLSVLPGGKVIKNMLSSPAAKAALKGAGVAGLAVGGYNVVQDVGERMTRLQAIGSEEGGDWSTGLKEDIHARMIGLDPYITTDQAREATQRAMSAGLQGDSRDQFRDMMIANFKDLGMAFGQSATLELTNLRGQELTDENVLKTRSEIDATVNTMKELSGDGGNTMALSERLKQLEQMTKSLNSLGFSAESIDQATLINQEGNKNSPAARTEAPRLTAEAMNSPILMSLVGTRLGVTDAMPGAMGLALEEAGYNPAEIEEIAYQEAAKVAAQEPKWYNRVAAFQALMAQMDVQMDIPTATEKYEQYAPPGRGKNKDAKVESGTPVQRGKEAIAAKGEKNEQTNWNPITGIADTLAPLVSGLNPFSDQKLSDVPGDMWDGFMGRHKPSENAQRTVDSFRRSGDLPDDQFGPAGQKGRTLPQSMQEVPRTTSSTGTVTGNVTITVDQQGRVNAPPTISLSGLTKSVNSGQGAGTLNSAPSASDYAANNFPGGPS